MSGLHSVQPVDLDHPPTDPLPSEALHQLDQSCTEASNDGEFCPTYKQ